MSKTKMTRKMRIHTMEDAVVKSIMKGRKSIHRSALFAIVDYMHGPIEGYDLNTSILNEVAENVSALTGLNVRYDDCTDKGNEKAKITWA